MAGIGGMRQDRSLRDWSLVEALADIALAAGACILRHYEKPDASHKDDGSPVTLADVEAEAIIEKRLAPLLPGVPIAAEEACSSGRVPQISDVFVLVDPLDGTKDFIARNGQFTVNIALVEARTPVLGVVFAPASGRIWLGADKAVAANVVAGGRFADARDRYDMHARKNPAEGLVALASRSHMNAETERLLARFPIAERRSLGSSIKFCEIAEGRADLYVRAGRTMEWDTAAGHAVLRAAGGDVRQPDGGPFLYGKREAKFANGDFIAAGDISIWD